MPKNKKEYQRKYMKEYRKTHPRNDYKKKGKPPLKHSKLNDYMRNYKAMRHRLEKGIEITESEPELHAFYVAYMKRKAYEQTMSEALDFHIQNSLPITKDDPQLYRYYRNVQRRRKK